MRLIGDPEKRLTVVDMAADVMNSDEFAMVYLYWKLLGRDPDTVGEHARYGSVAALPLCGCISLHPCCSQHTAATQCRKGGGTLQSSSLVEADRSGHCLLRRSV
eukprot:COSAG01_NODE_20634_length_943_cov_411.297393_2_plen_103_part_01